LLEAFAENPAASESPKSPELLMNSLLFMVPILCFTAD
jgi:hypothetical protein